MQDVQATRRAGARKEVTVSFALSLHTVGDDGLAD
jgi:hypothetical protein